MCEMSLCLLQYSKICAQIWVKFVVWLEKSGCVCRNHIIHVLDENQPRRHKLLHKISLQPVDGGLLRIHWLCVGVIQTVSAVIISLSGDLPQLHTIHNSWHRGAEQDKKVGFWDFSLWSSPDDGVR